MSDAPPNKGLQLSRALGAGAYSLVGWAAWDALVKVGPSQLKPSVGPTSGWGGRVRTRFQQGNRLLVQKRYAEALDEFLAHARDVPGEAPRAYVQAAECLRRTNTLTAPIPVEAGVTLVSQGDSAGAEAMYRKALAIDPAYFPALRGLVQVLPEGPAHRAVLEMAVGIRLDPLLVQRLGKIYENEGLLTEACDLYSRALESSPNDRDAKEALGRVKQRLS